MDMPFLFGLHRQQFNISAIRATPTSRKFCNVSRTRRTLGAFTMSILSKMTRKKKKETNDAVADANFEDMVGLLTTVGVLAALVMSVALGALMVDGRDDSLDGQYRWQLLSCSLPQVGGTEPNHPTDEGKNFRLFVINTLENQGFNFTVPLGGSTIDVREILERKLESVLDPWQNLESMRSGDLRDLELAYYLTRSAMPLDHVAAYSLRHDLKGATTSVTNVFGPGSVAFCSCSLLGTTIIYIMLPVEIFAEHFFRSERAALHSYGPDPHSR